MKKFIDWIGLTNIYNIPWIVCGAAFGLALSVYVGLLPAPLMTFGDHLGVSDAVAASR
jgi:hypothetical protein